MMLGMTGELAHDGLVASDPASHANPWPRSRMYSFPGTVRLERHESTTHPFILRHSVVGIQQKMVSHAAERVTKAGFGGQSPTLMSDVYWRMKKAESFCILTNFKWQIDLVRERQKPHLLKVSL